MDFSVYLLALLCLLSQCTESGSTREEAAILRHHVAQNVDLLRVLGFYPDITAGVRKVYEPGGAEPTSTCALFSFAQWCYQSQYSCDDTCRDPSRWAAQFPSCGGLRQSPINIVTSKVHVNSELPPFSFIGHTNTINITVENKGHSAHFVLPQLVQLTGGGLPGHYRAAQFHFHWGHNGRPGSEHTIDGERFPMELHIVHIKEPYGSLAEAEHDMAGIALLAFLFEETTEDHPHLNTVIAALGRVQNNGSSTVITNFQLSDIIPSAKELHSYYRYVGSMTTPGCEQAVAWTVFHKTLSISSRQLDAIVQQCRFWTGQPMVDIFRPTQPLDGRVVYRSRANAAPTGAVHLWFSFVSAMLGITGLTH